jgi:hypothetical protein
VGGTDELNLPSWSWYPDDAEAIDDDVEKFVSGCSDFVGLGLRK